jgi:ssDNA-binding Zn-finger/Zn-ribbon topoisomerase 1
MDAKECPLCGGNMRLKARAQTDRVPGSRESHTRRVSEWACPDCDYFEEAEESTPPKASN